MKSLTKHGFDIHLNRDVQSRASRRLSQIHISNQHPSLRQSINEYNRLSSEIRQLGCTESFKRSVRLKVINESEQFSAFSPYRYIN